jgi:hypothetical protein
LRIAGDQLVTEQKQKKRLHQEATSLAERLEALDLASLDTDGDGVADNRDHCQETPKGFPIDPNGCVYIELEGGAIPTQGVLPRAIFGFPSNGPMRSWPI